MPSVPGLRSSSTPLLIAGLALALALAAGGYVLAGGASSTTSTGTVEVTGVGNVNATPDTLTVQLSVVTSARSARQALAVNNLDMGRLQSVLLAAGVRSSDLQTTGLNVSPNYNNNGKISGYGAENDLSAVLHNISKSGAVIDAADNAVGNSVQINGIAFSLSNTSNALAQARTDAMEDARAEAASFAKGGAESLGSIVTISQTQTSTPPPVPQEFHAEAGVAQTPVPIKSGSEQISVQVDVTYRLIG